jgi:signal transduction histidine kinase
MAVEIRAEGGAGAPLAGDPQLLERAIRNLLHNAVEAEREGGGRGPVEVTLARGEAGAELTVDDRGPGVPAALRERLFHPFATGRASGVGLGLALAFRIAALHGGSLRLEDRPGGGTRAVLALPVDASDTEGNSSPPRRAAEAAGARGQSPVESGE